MHISCFSFWHHSMYGPEMCPSLLKFRSRCNWGLSLSNSFHLLWSNVSLPRGHLHFTGRKTVWIFSGYKEMNQINLVQKSQRTIYLRDYSREYFCATLINSTSYKGSTMTGFLSVPPLLFSDLEYLKMCPANVYWGRKIHGICLLGLG